MGESAQHAAKVFVVPPVEVSAKDRILALHRIIQARALDETLIDVTDYSHVRHGPGVMLLAHEAHYAFDEAEGRLGLLYARKRGGSGTTVERVRDAVRRALVAAATLEATEPLAGRLRFQGDELSVGIDDRLGAPNTPATFAAYRPALEAVLKTLYPGQACALEQAPDPRACFRVLVKAKSSATMSELAARLGG